MLTGSLKSFRHYKRIVTGLALVGPVLVLGAAYLWVDRVLLAPRVPDETTSALDSVTFICHEKGLPRLSFEETEAFLLQQTRRIFNDVTFAKQFAAALRTATPSEQQNFHAHVFKAFKPLLMRDIGKWLELAGDRKASYLDDRIVEYNRMSRMAARAPTAGADLGSGISVDNAATLKMVMENTTEAERQSVETYLKALAVRIGQILADPVLTAEFEKRIGISPPG